MAFVIMFHLQASADAALSCKPVWPVTKGDRDPHQNLPNVSDF